MIRKTTAIIVWGASAVLALTACSKDSSEIDAAKGEGSVAIAAETMPVVNEVVTRTDGAQIPLGQFGVPAEKLSATWVMAHLRTLVACVEDESKDPIVEGSANDYNRSHPRLSPVPAWYGVTMGSLSADRSVLPNYTDPTNGQQSPFEAPKYRYENPQAKLVPEVAEGDTPDYVYFEGVANFYLEGKEDKRVDVTVRVANTVISVEFSEAFINYFGEGARVTLTTKDGYTAQAAAYDEDSKPAAYDAAGLPAAYGKANAPKYFWVRPQDITLSAKATRQSPSPGIFQAEERDLGSYTHKDLAPQTWYRFYYDVTNVGGTTTGDDGHAITLKINDEPLYTCPLDDVELNPNA